MKRLIIAACVCSVLGAQSFEGMVYDARSGAPIAGVRVTVNSQNRYVSTLTDSAGRFRLADAANYPLTSTFTRAGYLTRNEFAPDGTGPAEWRVPLLPTARLLGRLVDSDGLAVRGAEVLALRLALINGHREWAGAASARTDDLGRFRITGLPAGRYRLQARPGNSNILRWDARYATSYYPEGVDAAQAKTVEVSPGQQVDGLNFQLIRQEGVTVSGRLVMPTGTRPSRPLQLVSQEISASGGRWSSLISANSGDGAFVIRHVRPGPLHLRVQSNALPGQATPFTGSAKLQVADRDVQGVEVEVYSSAPFDVPGRIKLDGHAPGVPIRISLRGNNSNAIHQAECDSEGAFLIKGIVPNDYTVSGVQLANSSSVASLRVSAATFAGEPILQFGAYFRPGADANLQIDAETLNARLLVEVRDPSGQSLPLAQVHFLDERTQRVYAAWAAPDGRRRLLAPAGLYRPIVWPESTRQQDSLDADYVDAHKNDFPAVQLSAGDNPPLTLRVQAR